jgi:hypothetical protein
MIYWLAPGTLFANGDADCRVVGFLAFYSLLFACTSENKQIGKLLTIIEDFSVSIGAIRECHGLPWGFSGQPVPVPVKTHTRTQGYGFW